LHERHPFGGDPMISSILGSAFDLGSVGQRGGKRQELLWVKSSETTEGISR
jgi:hypothetical protein